MQYERAVLGRNTDIFAPMYPSFERMAGYAENHIDQPERAAVGPTTA